MPRNIYRLKNGEQVPGTTRIVGQLSKGDALIQWAWKLGKEGKDWREERDKKGDTGTNVHDLILRFLTGEEVAVPGGTEGKRFKRFLKWWGEETKGQHLEVICETPLVSEELGFGGQPDIYIVTTDKLLDIKSGGKWVYDEWWIQLAGYEILLEEHGHKPKEKQILWLPESGFECPIRTDLSPEKRIFRHLLGIYYAKQACKGRK